MTPTSSAPELECQEPTTSVVARAFAVLGAFDCDRRELGISELARLTGLPKSTTHRMASDLVGCGVLVAIGSRYRLGLRLFELGTRWIPANLKDLYDPYLRDLSCLTKGTVHGAVLEGVEIVYLERITSHHWKGPRTRIGSRLPAYCTALGKAMLAHSPDAVVDRVVASGLLPRTPRTIVCAPTLGRELATIRTAGVAFDRQEYQSGVECVAAPILGERQAAISAVSVSVPAGSEDLDALAGSVKRTADTIAAIIRSSPSNYAVASRLGRAGSWHGRFTQ